MRVAQIACVFIHLLDGLCDLLVGVGGSADIFTNLLVALTVKVVYKGVVLRVAYVHGIGDGLNGWSGVIFSGL